jgi:putative ATPase
MVVLNGDAGEHGITVTDDVLAQCLSRKSLMYDRDGDEHYNLISALHKSMRNSDPDAAVYWMMRMLEGGEDPLYIARRVLRFAAEDVGLADPRAMEVGVAAYQACHFIGVPECNVHLAEAVVYMSLASKSNAMEMATQEAAEAIRKEPDAPVPLHIRNAPTSLMKSLDYGKGYQYAHDYAEKMTAMPCLPDNLKGRRFYHPTDQGQEARYRERLEQILAWKESRASGKKP